MSNDNYLHTDSIDLHFPNETDMKNEMKEVDIVKKRIPKRVLHFCDGTLEEYSSDDEESTLIQNEAKVACPVDPKLLGWGGWLWYQAVLAGVKMVGVCDYLGESLANFFGILSPKYGYEIEHYNRIMAEEENLKKQEDLEMAGWRPNTNIISDKPQVSAPLLGETESNRRTFIS